MSDYGLFAAKCLFGLLGILIGLACIRSRLLYGLPWVRFKRIMLTVLTVTRLSVFLAAFVVASLPAQSDVAVYYYSQAKAAATGSLPYRDFISSYGPGFPFLASLPLRLWDSPKSIILASILVELLSYWLWMKNVEKTGDDEVSRCALWLYVTSAFPLWNVGITGQNQVWASAFLAGTLLFAAAYRPVRSGLTLALSVLLVKFLPAMFFPAPARLSGSPFRYLVAFAFPLFVAYGVCRAFGVDLLFPVRFEGQAISSGNVWYLCTALGLDFSKNWVHLMCNAVAGATILLLCWVLIRAGKCDTLQGTLLAVSLVFLVFLVFSKKSYTNYLMIIYFPLCLALARSIRERGRTILRIFLFGVVFTVFLCEPSLWHRWMNQETLAHVGSAALPQSSYLVYAFVGVELLMLASYLWLILELRALLFTAQPLCQGSGTAPSKLLVARV